MQAGEAFVSRRNIMGCWTDPLALAPPRRPANLRGLAMTSSTILEFSAHGAGMAAGPKAKGGATLHEALGDISDIYNLSVEEREREREQQRHKYRQIHKTTLTIIAQPPESARASLIWGSYSPCLVLNSVRGSIFEAKKHMLEQIRGKIMEPFLSGHQLLCCTRSFGCTIKTLFCAIEIQILVWQKSRIQDLW